MNESEHLLEARRWLRYAHEDLAAAEALLGQPCAAARHSCWLAQQGDWPEATDADARGAAQHARAVWTSVIADLAREGLELDGSP